MTIDIRGEFYPSRFFGRKVMAVNAPKCSEVEDQLHQVAREAGTVVAWARKGDGRFEYVIVTVEASFDVGAELRKFGGSGTAAWGSIILSKLLTP